MIAFPDLANSVARHLNAGRGADLLLYLLALSGIFTGSAAGHFRSAACTGKEIARESEHRLAPAALLLALFRE
jgi:hypothetical protein